MAATSISFKWLDILEKEFDKAFVDLDIMIGDIDAEDPDVVYTARQKMATLSSCFAQLTHKAQTIFQNSAKVEAELVYLRAELVEAKAQHAVLDQQLHTLLLQLHASQLQHLPGLHTQAVEPDAERIRRRLEEELLRSPTHQHRGKDGFQLGLVEAASLKSEISQLRNENIALRNSILALQSEVYGAKLAAKYLDKELAGRIQQLQLLGREMRGEVRDKLWRQLESEILLHRHKTVIRACRNRGADNSNHPIPGTTERSSSDNTRGQQGIGEPRVVTVKREAGEGLGISITGGREHGVPILISELEPDGPAARCGALYVGDAILNVNGHDLKQACHQEAVDVLSSQTGDICMQVHYIAAEDSDDENSLGDDMYGFRYRFFDDEVLEGGNPISLHPLHNGYNHEDSNGSNRALLSTPTAPRTPESPNMQSRNVSDCSLPGSPATPSANKKQSAVPATTISVSTNSPLSCQSTTDPSPCSPMQISTDESITHARSSNSEDSPSKSPCKKEPPVNNNMLYNTNENNTTFNGNNNNINNINNNKESTHDEESLEEKVIAETIGISTLQQIFSKSSTNSKSPERKSSTPVADGKIETPSLDATMQDPTVTQASPVHRLTEDSRSPSSEEVKVPRRKSKSTATKSPDKVKAKAQSKTRVEAALKFSETEPLQTKPPTGKTSSDAESTSPVSPVHRHAGRKSTSNSSRGSNYSGLKLSDKGRRSGKAQRMVQSSTSSSSFEDEQSLAAHKATAGRKSEREVSVLAVGSSPSHHLNPDIRHSTERVTLDSFGDPGFGTPV